MKVYKTLVDTLNESKKRNRILFYLGMLLLFIFTLFVISFGFCLYSLSRICEWLKPCKFAISFAIYVFSLGWFMEYLKVPLGENKIKRLSWLISFLILAEVTLILAQSLTASVNTPIPLLKELPTDTLFLLGNIIILMNTALAAYIGIQFFRKLPLTPVSYLWAIRAGFLIFVISSLVGLFLVMHYGQTPPSSTHFGLPFTQFSSNRDNLISLHFLGIHSLQILPLCGYFFHDRIGKVFMVSTVMVYSCSCLFFILTI